MSQVAVDVVWGAAPSIAQIMGRAGANDHKCGFDLVVGTRGAAVVRIVAVQHALTIVGALLDLRGGERRAKNVCRDNDLDRRSGCQGDVAGWSIHAIEAPEKHGSSGVSLGRSEAQEPPRHLTRGDLGGGDIE